MISFFVIKSFDYTISHISMDTDKMSNPNYLFMCVSILYQLTIPKCQKLLYDILSTIAKDFPFNNK